jgi:hypothetical protein
MARSGAQSNVRAIFTSRDYHVPQFVNHEPPFVNHPSPFVNTALPCGAAACTTVGQHLHDYRTSIRWMDTDLLSS